MVNGTPVKFTASLSQQYQVKSTTVDNPFDVDKQIGIFAGSPIVANNVAYKVSSMPTTEPAAAGALVPVNEESPILWKQGQSAATTFYAYTPIGTSEDASAIPVTVPADQSTLSALNNADFMAATALDVTPGNAAALSFGHKFHKVIVLVENKLAQDVTKVQIKNVKMAGSVDLTAGTVAASGEATGVIDAYATGTTANKVIETVNHTYDVYTAIIIPQTAQPQIVVTIGANTTYTYSLGASMAFAGNQTATATLVVESAAASANAASFSFSVGEWGANTDMEYGDGQKGLADPFCWSIIGNVMGTSWNQDFYMTQNPSNENEYFILGFTIAPGDSFKFRKGSAWADETHLEADGYLQFGLPSGTASVTIPDEGANVDLASSNNVDIVIAVAAATQYDIYLKPTENKVWIKESE